MKKKSKSVHSGYRDLGIGIKGIQYKSFQLRSVYLLLESYKVESTDVIVEDKVDGGDYSIDPVISGDKEDYYSDSYSRKD